MKKSAPAVHNAALRLEYRPVGKLVPYEKNARTHPPAQLDKIKRLIEMVGFVVPILVDGKNGILKGHGSLQAARQLGMRTVPVIELKGLSPAAKRAYILADNRVAEDAGWDQSLLAIEMGDLKSMGVDLALTGFDPAEINLILEPPPSEQPEPPEALVQGTPISKAGDLWLLGENRLICGDSTKPDTLKRLMDGREAQCVFTDPPYGVSYEAPSGAHEVIRSDELRRGQLAQLLRAAFSAALPHVRKDAGWYVWHASKTRDDFAVALRDVGLVEQANGYIMWVKPPTMGWTDYNSAAEPCFYAARQGVRPAFHGDRTGTTIWRADARTANGEASVAVGAGMVLTTPDGQELYVSTTAPKGRKVRHVHLKAGEPVLLTPVGEGDTVWEVGRDNGHGKDGSLHPTMKPVELARRALKNSTQEGEIVLDVFSGAGSTIMAAEQMKRCGYGVELDPRYVDATVRRWQQMTGKEAIHATENKTFEAVSKARAGRASAAKGPGAAPRTRKKA